MKNTRIENNEGLTLEVTQGNSLIVNLLDEKIGRKGSYFLEHTHHSQMRSNQRGIDNLAITLVIEYGKIFYKQGLEFYVVGDKSLPRGIDTNLKKRLQNTVVVLTTDAHILTCYRGNNVMKHIHRKQKYLSAA